MIFMSNFWCCVDLRNSYSKLKIESLTSLIQLTCYKDAMSSRINNCKLAKCFAGYFSHLVYKAMLTYCMSCKLVAIVAN